MPLCKHISTPPNEFFGIGFFPSLPFDIGRQNEKVPEVETHHQKTFPAPTAGTNSGWIAKDAPQARLLLGMSAVGCWVVISVLGLATLPVPQNAAPLPTELAKIGYFLVCYTAISLPFDWIGGSLIPRTFHLSRPVPFWRPWFRGALGHAVFLGMIAASLLLASRQGGTPLLLTGFALILLTLIGAQKQVTCLLASHTETRSSKNKEGIPAIALGSSDSAFSGGIVGWPGRERIIQPAHWQNKLPTALYKHLLERRTLAILTKQRTRGLLVASAWVVSGFTLALCLNAGALDTAEALLRMAFCTSLWQFLGLLLLPTLSRRAAIRLDYDQIQHGATKQKQQEFIRRQSELEDGEDQRSTVVETIFHPLPSVLNRLAELDRKPRFSGAWNANRMMLYLNWSSLGLLSRAVHCNVGRPALWALPPVD